MCPYSTGKEEIPTQIKRGNFVPKLSVIKRDVTISSECQQSKAEKTSKNKNGEDRVSQQVGIGEIKLPPIPNNDEIPTKIMKEDNNRRSATKQYPEPVDSNISETSVFSKAKL